ncbi:AAA family ATPase (plasmid) [Paenibacillus thiaminolyticus]|uniref:guanylate kinase n=1 Tax=Paenibacillus thiaminolyticus TaxID=49283 RepID=UPI00232D39DC|nr:AAA family ATPase [Paenibacillus thiaminolyticus]WCF11639.1 AAA family ATPase [Paenibacillus thiaminolyticus]
MKERIIVFYGPSGCGKSTMIEYCRSLGLPVAVNYTTRSLRDKDNEVDGIHYHFVSEDVFFSMDLVERNSYPSEDGLKWYGIGREEITSKMKENKQVIVIAEINGIKELKKAFPGQVIAVFITVSLTEMERRMRKRGDSEKSIQTRISNAIQRKEHNQGYLADHIIENWDLEQSFAQVRQIVLQPKNNER